MAFVSLGSGKSSEGDPKGCAANRSDRGYTSRMAPVTHDAAVDEAMKVVDAALPSAASAPKVNDLRVELATDSNGREAAFITLVLEDSPSGEPYPWTRLKPLHDLIWKAFTERGVSRWPYITFRLKSEKAEGDEGGDAATSAGR